MANQTHKLTVKKHACFPICSTERKCFRDDQRSHEQMNIDRSKPTREITGKSFHTLWYQEESGSIPQKQGASQKYECFPSFMNLKYSFFHAVKSHDLLSGKYELQEMPDPQWHWIESPHRQTLWVGASFLPSGVCRIGLYNPLCIFLVRRE